LVRAALAKAGVRAALLVLPVLALGACTDSSGPHPSGPAVTIVPLTDSAFEGDVVSLTARVLDDAGADIPGASVTWTASDTTLAKVAGPASFALLRPGTVRITARSGAISGTYDLVIGRLVVKSVEVTPGTLSLGRGDRLQLGATVRAQGGRTIANRPVSFTSDDSLVATVGGPQSQIGAPGFLFARGAGSTTIRATIDGVTGTAHVGVVIADTNFALTHFNGAAIPALVAADSVDFFGVREFAEVYADTGTLVLSGLLQPRYALSVRFSQYHVFRVGDTVQRELRFRFNGEVDHGVVTTGANGSLTMLSEFMARISSIVPRCSPTATSCTSRSRGTISFWISGTGDCRREFWF